MIISWFTQPERAFASYYQYDTVTKSFSRTRLELGRESQDRTNDTFTSFKSQRAIGFSKDVLTTKNPGDHWSINLYGQLCFDGETLPKSRPVVGYRVYDSSDPQAFVHRGRVVTEQPRLPAGIKPKHLVLLANQSMVDKKDFVYTKGTAQPAELAKAIRKMVCEILEIDSFTQVNDDLILTKYKEQISRIKSDSPDGDYDGLAEASSVAAYLDEIGLGGVVSVSLVY